MGGKGDDDDSSVSAWKEMDSTTMLMSQMSLLWGSLSALSCENGEGVKHRHTPVKMPQCPPLQIKQLNSY